MVADAVRLREVARIGGALILHQRHEAAAAAAAAAARAVDCCADEGRVVSVSKRFLRTAVLSDVARLHDSYNTNKQMFTDQSTKILKISL